MKQKQNIHLTSKIPPSVNHYLAYRATIKNGKPLAVSYKTPESVKYRNEFSDYVRAEVLKQKWDTNIDKNQHFYADAVFYFERIDQDPNNYWKIPLDAITDTQLIWADDNVVCERVLRILYDPDNPRIEIDIHPVEYIGVFDNASHLEEFTARCIGCTRYARNCSILQKAKEGRIQEEIKNGVCAKFNRVKGVKKNDGKD